MEPNIPLRSLPTRRSAAEEHVGRYLCTASKTALCFAVIGSGAPKAALQVLPSIAGVEVCQPATIKCRVKQEQKLVGGAGGGAGDVVNVGGVATLSLDG